MTRWLPVEILRFMDTNQTRIIELLREVHLIAFKEIERLNLRVAELESTDRRQLQLRDQNPTTPRPSTSTLTKTEVMTDKQVASHLNISLATMRRWRLFRKGPKFFKMGAAVRYRREDVDRWLASCSGPV
jgi:excisionase family DNA binding protein